MDYMGKCIEMWKEIVEICEQPATADELAILCPHERLSRIKTRALYRMGIIDRKDYPDGLCFLCQDAEERFLDQGLRKKEHSDGICVACQMRGAWPTSDDRKVIGCYYDSVYSEISRKITQNVKSSQWYGHMLHIASLARKLVEAFEAVQEEKRRNDALLCEIYLWVQIVRLLERCCDESSNMLGYLQGIKPEYRLARIKEMAWKAIPRAGKKLPFSASYLCQDVVNATHQFPLSKGPCRKCQMFGRWSTVDGGLVTVCYKSGTCYSEIFENMEKIDRDNAPLIKNLAEQVLADLNSLQREIIISKNKKLD